MEQKKDVNEEYQKWWAENRERVLAEDALNHSLNFKNAISQDLDLYLENQNTDDDLG